MTVHIARQTNQRESAPWSPPTLGARRDQTKRSIPYV